MTAVDDALRRAEIDRAKFEGVGVPLWLIDRLILAAEVEKLREEAAHRKEEYLAGISAVQVNLLRRVIERMDNGAVDCAAVWWLGDVADAVEEGREW